MISAFQSGCVSGLQGAEIAETHAWALGSRFPGPCLLFAGDGRETLSNIYKESNHYPRPDKGY